MASQWPPVKNVAYSFEVALFSQADPTTLKSAPTLAAGDFKLSLDGAAPVNSTNTPTASGTVVTVALTQAEMNHDRIHIVWVDAAGAEWISGFTNLFTAATNQDGLATPTNITAGTITTVTNLTNAPTAGDLTAAMKTSVTTAATAATPVAASVAGNVVGSVGSVTGNVGGNVVGSVASVTATVNADMKKINGTTVNGNGAGTPWGP